jgi:WD40 repeat protein
MISLAWSPDGMMLAMAPEVEDTRVRIWSVASGRELHTLEGHSDYVKTVVWSPDGALLATGSEDGTVRVWGIAGE